MKRILLAITCGAVLAIMAVVAVGSPARGQTPPPPPTISGIPGPPPPPCPPGCPTDTPTPIPTNTPTPTPTNTPTPTPTNTPIPLFVQVKLQHKTVKAGAKQKVTVTTLPGAHVTIQVVFPNKTKKHHGGTADESGGYSWSFKQPSGVTTRTSSTAKVTATASNGADSLKASKSYKVG